VSKSKDFAYIEEDIKQTKKRKDEKTISLNEKVRQKEKDEYKATTEARKKERASRPPSGTSIFELDLTAAEAGKPLVAFNPNKAKEDADAASAAAATPEDSADADADADTDSGDAAVDPHLDETIQVLRDYTRLLNKGANPAVAVKKD
jgi:hypothetical protein